MLLTAYIDTLSSRNRGSLQHSAWNKAFLDRYSALSIGLLLLVLSIPVTPLS